MAKDMAKSSIDIAESLALDGVIDASTSENRNHPEHGSGAGRRQIL
jgi:hypothetical protein